MATIEDVERYEAEVRAAEAAALCSIISSMREAVIELSVESQLARRCVKLVSTLEAAARSREVSGEHALWAFERDVKKDNRETAARHMRDAVDCLAVDDPLRRPIEDLADILGGE
jgi:hypothetical protein